MMDICEAELSDDTYPIEKEEGVNDREDDKNKIWWGKRDRMPWWYFHCWDGGILKW